MTPRPSDELDRLLAPAEPHVPARRAPAGFAPGESSWDGKAGYAVTRPLEKRPTTWDAHLKDAFPDENITDLEVVEPVQVRGWDMNTGGGNIVRAHYYKLTVRRRSAHAVDLPALLKEARRSRRKAKPPTAGVPETVVMVHWADAQTGKVASRGGTPELVARTGVALDRLEQYLARVKPDAAVLMDVGDVVEGFENTGGQQFTNDLSLPEQLDVAATLEFAAIDLLASRVGRVSVRGIGSNHCQWRKGKDILGKPSDDWGLYLLKQQAKALALNPAAYGHVDIEWPREWDETLAFDAAGYIIGLAHGHGANRPDGIPDWWAKQTHGGQPVAHADILVTGHFHHLRIQPSGRNPHTDRSKWWVQSPTMDNGSDWYRHRAGDDSDPGLLVYTLRRGVEGFPFHDLQIL